MDNLYLNNILKDKILFSIITKGIDLSVGEITQDENISWVHKNKFILYITGHSKCDIINDIICLSKKEIVDVLEEIYEICDKWYFNNEIIDTENVFNFNKWCNNVKGTKLNNKLKFENDNDKGCVDKLDLFYYDQSGIPHEVYLDTIN